MDVNQTRSEAAEANGIRWIASDATRSIAADVDTNRTRSIVKGANRTQLIAADANKTRCKLLKNIKTLNCMFTIHNSKKKYLNSQFCLNLIWCKKSLLAQIKNVSNFFLSNMSNERITNFQRTEMEAEQEFRTTSVAPWLLGLSSVVRSSSTLRQCWIQNKTTIIYSNIGYSWAWLKQKVASNRKIEVHLSIKLLIKLWLIFVFMISIGIQTIRKLQGLKWTFTTCNNTEILEPTWQS